GPALRRRLRVARSASLDLPPLQRLDLPLAQPCWAGLVLRWVCCPAFVRRVPLNCTKIIPDNPPAYQLPPGAAGGAISAPYWKRVVTGPSAVAVTLTASPPSM